MMGRSGKFREKLKEPGKSNLQVGPIVVTFARSFTPRLATTELKAGFRRGRQEARLLSISRFPSSPALNFARPRVWLGPGSGSAGDVIPVSRVVRPPRARPGLNRFRRCDGPE